MPENRKSSFDPLPDWWQAATSLCGILFSYQQTIVLLKQFCLQLFPSVTQISNDCLIVEKFSQAFGNC